MIEGGCEKLETETKGHVRQPGCDPKPGPALGGDLAMMKIKDYNHIGIVVRDLEKCKHFYGEILGLKTIFRPPFNFPGHWYQVGPGTQLHLMVYDETIPQTMRHTALEVEDFGKALEHLKANGVAIVEGPGKRYDGSDFLFCKDPDGNLMEITKH